MIKHNVFLSVVIPLRNCEKYLVEITKTTLHILDQICTDYELIIVDNSSDDQSVSILRNLSESRDFPNLQVYALTNSVSNDTACWVGVENSLGDYVAIIDPLVEDIRFLTKMLDNAVSGFDVVFASNEYKTPQSLSYRLASSCFNFLFNVFNGVRLEKEAPQYRILSKRVVNFILQHREPSITYRYLPATGGFSRANLNYVSVPRLISIKGLGDSIDRGVRLLVSTTQAPMRLVTSLSLFGAVANLIYSIYVIIISVFGSEVAPGWVSISLQQSGMFFLISLVLFVLGEYILQMASLTNSAPLYHVGQEFTSVRMTRKEKLNIEDLSSLSMNGMRNSI